jgi:hypothetical protein
MFGHQLGFNINGEDIYRTNTGSCATILIFVVVIVATQFSVREY